MELWVHALHLLASDLHESFGWAHLQVWWQVCCLLKHSLQPGAILGLSSTFICFNMLPQVSQAELPRVSGKPWYYWGGGWAQMLCLLAGASCWLPSQNRRRALLAATAWGFFLLCESLCLQKHSWMMFTVIGQYLFSFSSCFLCGAFRRIWKLAACVSYVCNDPLTLRSLSKAVYNWWRKTSSPRAQLTPPVWAVAVGVNQLHDPTALLSKRGPGQLVCTPVTRAVRLIWPQHMPIYMEGLLPALRLSHSKPGSAFQLLHE